MNHIPFSTLIGKRVEKIYRSEDAIYLLASGEWYSFDHKQECCESVVLDTVDGTPITAHVGHEILDCEELVWTSEMGTPSPQQKQPDDFNLEEEALGWTMYRIRTSAGVTTFWWLGVSNGYYGVSAELFLLDSSPDGEEAE